MGEVATLKINDVLYKYQGFGKLAGYICTGIIKRDKLTQYEMECQNCDHGFKCRILVAQKPFIRGFSFLAMVNDDTGEYDCWHTTHKESELFYLTSDAAKIAVYEGAIAEKYGEIAKTKSALSRLENELVELEGHFKNILKPQKD